MCGPRHGVEPASCFDLTFIYPPLSAWREGRGGSNENRPDAHSNTIPYILYSGRKFKGRNYLEAKDTTQERACFECAHSFPNSRLTF